jgi:hypothetical protein
MDSTWWREKDRGVGWRERVGGWVGEVGVGVVERLSDECLMGVNPPLWSRSLWVVQSVVSVVSVVSAVVYALSADSASKSSNVHPVLAMARSDWQRRAGVQRGLVLVTAAASEARVSGCRVGQETRMALRAWRTMAISWGGWEWVGWGEGRKWGVGLTRGEGVGVGGDCGV